MVVCLSGLGCSSDDGGLSGDTGVGAGIPRGHDDPGNGPTEESENEGDGNDGNTGNADGDGKGDGDEGDGGEALPAPLDIPNIQDRSSSVSSIKPRLIQELEEECRRNGSEGLCVKVLERKGQDSDLTVCQFDKLDPPAGGTIRKDETLWIVTGAAEASCDEESPGGGEQNPDGSTQTPDGQQPDGGGEQQPEGGTDSTSEGTGTDTATDGQSEPTTTS